MVASCTICKVTTINEYSLTSLAKFPVSPSTKLYSVHYSFYNTYENRNLLKIGRSYSEFLHYV